jgi:hypothetical protein
MSVTTLNSETYQLADRLQMLREQAIEAAIGYYYLTHESVIEDDMEHLAEYGEITNYSNGRMDFGIGGKLLVTFGPVEYKVDIDNGGATILCRQEITEHY